MNVYTPTHWRKACPFHRQHGRLRTVCVLLQVETLLPTYVWQHHADLIPASSPPLTMRVWGVLGWAENLTSARETLLQRSTAFGSTPYTPRAERDGRVPASRVEALVADVRCAAAHGHAHAHALKFPKHEFNHLNRALLRVFGEAPVLTLPGC
jgi:hypothetical protein